MQQVAPRVTLRLAPEQQLVELSARSRLSRSALARVILRHGLERVEREGLGALFFGAKAKRATS